MATVAESQLELVSQLASSRRQRDEERNDEGEKKAAGISSQTH